MIWIVWEEQSSKFSHWEYVGDAITVPRFTTETITKRCRYSSDMSDEMIERARQYVKSDMQDRENAQVIVGEED